MYPRMTSNVLDSLPCLDCSHAILLANNGELFFFFRHRNKGKTNMFEELAVWVTDRLATMATSFYMHYIATIYSRNEPSDSVHKYFPGSTTANKYLNSASRFKATDVYRTHPGTQMRMIQFRDLVSKRLDFPVYGSFQSSLSFL